MSRNVDKHCVLNRAAKDCLFSEIKQLEQQFVTDSLNGEDPGRALCRWVVFILPWRWVVSGGWRWCWRRVPARQDWETMKENTTISETGMPHEMPNLDGVSV